MDGGGSCGTTWRLCSSGIDRERLTPITTLRRNNLPLRCSNCNLILLQVYGQNDSLKWAGVNKRAPNSALRNYHSFGRRGAAMRRAVRGPRGGAPRGCVRLRAVMLIVVLLACAVPRTLAMRGFVAGAFRTAERTLREKGLLPGPDDDGSQTRRESPSDEDASAAEGDAAADAAGASEVIVEADEPGDDAEVDPMHDTTLPPAERLFRVATRTTEERPHSQRAARRAAALLREALELDPNHAPALTALGRAHQAGEGVDADDATALDLFRRAANLGDAGKFIFIFVSAISMTSCFVHRRARRTRLRALHRMGRRERRHEPSDTSPVLRGHGRRPEGADGDGIQALTRRRDTSILRGGTSILILVTLTGN